MDDKIIANKLDLEKAITDACNCGDYAAAQELAVKALNIAKDSGELDSKLAHVIHTLAATQCLERRYKEAERLYSQILAVKEKILGPSHPDIVDILERLAVVTAETKGKTAAMAIAFRARCLDIGIR